MLRGTVVGDNGDDLRWRMFCLRLLGDHEWIVGDR